MMSRQYVIGQILSIVGVEKKSKELDELTNEELLAVLSYLTLSLGPCKKKGPHG